jgi:electron transfer flavoprotein beta subunit
MRVIVFVKHVKYVYAQTGSDPRENYIGPDDIVRIINPLDESALEQALRIKDQHADTETIVVSLGDALAEEGLRRSLAMGADRAIHIHDEDYENLDAWATAMVLADFVRDMKFQLILCGAQAVDRNDGLVGPYVAEMLGITHLSRVAKAEMAETSNQVVVHRAVERGNREILECTLPALFTIDRRVGTPRYPTVPGFLKAQKADVQRVELEDIGTTPDRFDPASNMTDTRRVSRPKPKVRAQKQTDGKLSASERLKLMMKGGDSKEKEQSAIMEGVSDDVLREVERLLRESGVEFTRDD